MEEGPHKTPFYEHFWQQRLLGTKWQIRGGGTQRFRKAGLLLKGPAQWGRGTLHGLLLNTFGCSILDTGMRRQGGREGREMTGRWMFLSFRGSLGKWGNLEKR